MFADRFDLLVAYISKQSDEGIAQLVRALA